MRDVIRVVAGILAFFHFLGFIITSIFHLDSMREDADLTLAITAPLWVIAYLLASVENPGDDT